VFFFFLNIIRANDCRERKRRCARVPAVCVNAACAECININDVFCRKDAVKALFETAFLKRRKRRELTFFFHHKRTSFHLISRSRKEKEMKGKFSTSSQKLKKLVCGCLEDRGGGRKEREREKSFHKTTQNRRKREKEKRKEKLCVFNVGVGLA